MSSQPQIPRPKLIISRCPSCGLLVAASANPKMIELAQRAHRCLESPASGHQPPRKQG